MEAITNFPNNEQEDISVVITDRTDELLHMILNMKQDKGVDLHRMQTLVLAMYKDSIDLLHTANELNNILEMKKRRNIEIPKFMCKNGREAQ